MDENNGGVVSKIDLLYRDYGKRAGVLKNQGKRIIGYTCSFVPQEIIHASGAVPFRLRGDVNEPITKGDNNMETIACPYMRSCFDLSVKGRYDFLSGLIIPHACDSMARTYSVWKYCLNLPYSHFINIPHTLSESSMEFFREELKGFIRSLGRFTGVDITDERLRESVSLYNRNREKVMSVYELRKSDPPMVSGAETAKLLTVCAGLPVEEANDLLDEALDEFKTRERSPFQKFPRLMIDGACIDNVDLIKLIEQSGANVVVDTLCLGTRDHWPMVDEKADPVKSLAERYLEDLNCPRTYRENQTGSYQDDLEFRFGDIKSFAGEFKVNGAVIYHYKYCDPFGFEIHARKTFFDSLDVPSLYLEDEYSSGSIGQLKTRIQAFVEMLE